MKCKVCGNPLAEDARFCTECGAQIDKDADASTEEAKAPQAEKVLENDKEVLVFSSDETEDNSSAKPAMTEEKPESLPKNDGKELVFSSDEAEAPVKETKAPESAVNSAVKEQNNTAEISEAVQETADKEKPPVKIGAGRIFGASLISVLAIVLLTAVGLLLSAKIGLNGTVLKNRAQDANLAAILDSDLNDNITTIEYIYNNIGSALMSDRNVEPKDLRSFLIEADFENFIGDALEAYSGYIIDGNSKDPSVSSADFTEFFRENNKIAAKEFRYEMTETDYKNMRVRLENRGFDDALSVDSWSSELGFDVGNLSYVFSYLTLGIVAAAALFMFVWIAIIVDKKARHIAGFYGNITLISGIIMFLPSAAFLLGASSIAFATNTLAAYLSAELLVPFALIALCTGAFEIILAVIFKLIRKAAKKKELKA